MLEIVIPQYIRQFKVSNSVRPIYYEWDGTDIRARRKSGTVGKPLLKKYINSIAHSMVLNKTMHPVYLKDKYTLLAKSGSKSRVIYRIPRREFSPLELKHWLVTQKFFTSKQASKLKFYVYDMEANCIVVANESKAGNAAYRPINGQDFYSGNVTQFTRVAMIRQIKESFLPYVKDIKPINVKPCKVELFIFDTVRNALGSAKSGDGVAWDIGNRGMPYLKSMLDLLVTGKTGEMLNENEYKIFFEPKLVDDDRLHINSEGYTFVPIDNESDRKLIFQIKLNENPYSI